MEQTVACKVYYLYNSLDKRSEIFYCINNSFSFLCNNKALQQAPMFNSLVNLSEYSMAREINHNMILKENTLNYKIFSKKTCWMEKWNAHLQYRVSKMQSLFLSLPTKYTTTPKWRVSLLLFNWLYILQ